MPFTVTEDNLKSLFNKANFEIPTNEMIFVGIRGCIPIDVTGTAFASSQMLEYIGTDYLHFRCTILQWSPGQGFAVFPASTVPHLSGVQAGISRGGQGVNQLSLGYYRGSHRYYRGFHKAGVPQSRHRAFRNDSVLPVWRTADDTDYEGDDQLDTTSIPGDNIHCAWQQNASAASFSSDGCQVIVGRPQVLARGWNIELGPWAKFVENAYSLTQDRFRYALFSGRELLSLVAGGSQAPTVRFGSEGDLVKVVQDALVKHGYDLGAAGVDGDCGFATITALRQFQAGQFGKAGVDLIVGPGTAQALGIAWPRTVAEPVPPMIGPVVAPSGPAVPAPTAASASASAPASVPPGAEPPADGTNYRSLTPGGFFSKTPFDTSVKRAIRTNNPGALNITGWQRAFPGFAGVTQPDSVGNRTTIYVTPEHGVGAWHFLMTDRYGLGPNGTIAMNELARRYAGVPSVDHPAAKGYVAGWSRFSGNVLQGSTILKLDDDSLMMPLARGMFGHEIGAASPLHDDQIRMGLALKRAGTLPAS